MWTDNMNVFRALILLFGFLVIHGPSRAAIGGVIATVFTGFETYKPYSYVGLGIVVLGQILLCWPNGKRKADQARLVVESRRVVKH